MTVSSVVGFRFSELDKAALVEISRRLNMSKSQTIRALVRETLIVLNEREQQTTNETNKQPAIQMK